MNMMTTATQTTPLDTFMLELPKTDTVRNLFCPFQPHEKWLGRAVFT